ncbi:MAG: 3-isopropylmalate dehydratase small subunit [Wenzhouxiangellaceae bacterium]|nr:3-isopropylmalate dehydratase small subunit [Wenzhouxiangellaceae bacterium]
MKPIKTLESTTLVLPESSIDTDQIIPARFLTTTERSGLGRAAFADWRFDEAGAERADCVLNSAAARSAEVLVGGDNFGCGSSREHAVWALMDFGVRAVVSCRLADIFRANALKNGLLAIEVDTDTHRWLLEHPGARVTLDVSAGTLTTETGPECSFALDPFARNCLLEGVDALGWLLARTPEIEAWETQRREAA